MKIRAAIAALSLSACVGASQPDITIDFGGVCGALDLALRDPDGLLPGTEVHAFAAADPTGAGWALITHGPELLALQRVPAEPGEDPYPLGLSTSQVANVQLLPGPDIGEVWVEHASSSAIKIWRVSDDGVVASRDFGASFPEVSGLWERRLLFVGREPALLAAPESAENETVGFMLASLTPELDVDMLWELTFGTECVDVDGIACIPASYPRIHLLDIADADGVSPGLILFEFERAFEGISTLTTGVATLEVDLDLSSGLPRALKREYYDLLWGHSITPLRIDPGEIARDGAGYYIIAGVEDTGVDDPEVSVNDLLTDRLIRHDHLASVSGIIARLPKYTNSHLLQLTNQVGLGQAFDGFWYAARMVGFTIDFDDVEAIDIAEDGRVSSAGHSHMLIRGGGTSARGQIACAEADDDPDAAPDET